MSIGDKKSVANALITGDRLRYTPSTREVPMTLQIAAVATDGVVLASDQKKNLLVAHSDEPVTSSLVSKIFYSEDRQIIAAWSGADPSMRLARFAITIPDSELKSFIAIEGHANRIFDEESKKLEMEHMNGEVLIVDGRDLSKVWCVHVQRQSYCDAVISKAIAGHTSNPATYFTERFYEKLPMKRLVPLLAHTILESAKMNPSGIEGLEIFNCRKDLISRVHESEIELFKLQHQELSAVIENYLKPMVAD